MSEMVSRSVEIGDSVLYQNVGDEIVLLNLASQEYFGLDSVGADVWQLLMQNGDIETAVRGLAAIYAVDEQKAHGEIQPFISDLLAAKLLKVASSSDK